MPKIKLKFLPLFSTFLLSGMGNPLMAQRVINYRLTAFGMGKIKSVELSNLPGGKGTIDSRRGYVTKIIEARLREDSYLDFYKSGVMPAEGEVLKPLYSLKIPADARDQLLVLMMHDGGKVRPILMDFKKLGFKPGQQLVWNLLPSSVGVEFQSDGKRIGTAKQVPGGKRVVLEAPSVKKTLRMFYFQNPKTKKVKLFSSSLFIRDDRSWEILFVYAKKGADTPILSPVSIFDEPKPPAETARP